MTFKMENLHLHSHTDPSEKENHQDVFTNVSENVPFSEIEERILRFWDQVDAFKTSFKLSQGRPQYTFYDGPPFATGLPHYGHILAGTIKDIVTRYAHQTGHHVSRRFGWDCHGLPVEYEIDKTLKITGPEDVHRMGIEKYNAECRAVVMRYASEWEVVVKRLGRWIDFQNDFKTMDLKYMETVWWVFKQLYEKGLVYRGFKVMPFSTGCCTPLSNFEATQNYKEVSDPSIVVAFPLEEDPTVEVLAWTTTPWTLPSNLALCMHPDHTYVKLHDQASGRVYVLMEKRLEILYKHPQEGITHEILSRFPGKDFQGKRYKPLFEYFLSSSSTEAPRFVILVDTYVTDESGTGIVQQAPGFGEDDYRVCMNAGVISKEDTSSIICPVDVKGRFTQSVCHFSGQYVKDADKDIIKHLKQSGRLVSSGTIVHSYPFCWRSDTPLLYMVVPSWFVRVEQLIPHLLKNNKQSCWVPDFVQEKKFHNWLNEARDWAISRNRYWGTPIPLWTSEDKKEIVCVGSIAELENLSQTSGITDLHRDSIDDLTIPSTQDHGVLHRIPEVFDCWFESGCVPYGQIHYPFENKETFCHVFPADFIAEGLDQTRGWFYTLLVISTALFNQPPFKNLIVNGLILAADGKKMSKRLRNYADPMNIMHTYGSDALRVYLVNSPVVRAETLRFQEAGVRNVVREILLPWYNAFRFFVQCTEMWEKDQGIHIVYEVRREIHSTNIMDRWILACCQSLLRFVKQEMEAYRLYTVIPRLLRLIDELTNWYVRFNRDRLKGKCGLSDSRVALSTLFEVLFTLCRSMAMFTPFITEAMYQTLRKRIVFPSNEEELAQDPLGWWKDTRSIHFLPFPTVHQSYTAPDIERAVSRMQTVVDLGRTLRDRHTLSLRTPLRRLVVLHKDPQYHADVKPLDIYIRKELNVRETCYSTDERQYGVKYRADPDPRLLGPRLGKDFKRISQAIRELSSDALLTMLPSTASENAPISNHSSHSTTVNILGVDLNLEELRVTRYFDQHGPTLPFSMNSSTHQPSLSPESISPLPPHFESNGDGDVLILLDIFLDEHLVEEGLAREIVTYVQKLRKKAGLQASDVINYGFQYVNVSIPSDDPVHITHPVLHRLFEGRSYPLLESLLKQHIRPYVSVNNQPCLLGIDSSLCGRLLLSEERELSTERFQLFLLERPVSPS